MKLNKTSVGRHIGKQLMRSATSAGANYEEACGAESRADFIHKMQVSLKELRETFFWLRFLKMAEIISDKETVLLNLIQENKELLNIIGKAVSTAKINRTKSSD